MHRSWSIPLRGYTCNLHLSFSYFQHFYCIFAPNFLNCGASFGTWYTRAVSSSLRTCPAGTRHRGAAAAAGPPPPTMSNKHPGTAAAKPRAERPTPTQQVPAGAQQFWQPPPQGMPPQMGMPYVQGTFGNPGGLGCDPVGIIHVPLHLVHVLVIVIGSYDHSPGHEITPTITLLPRYTPWGPRCMLSSSPLR